MARNHVYALKMFDEERQMLAAVARKLQRGDADAVRVLIRAAAEELGVVPTQEEAPHGPKQR